MHSSVYAAGLLATLSIHAAALAAPPQSVSKIAFGPDNVLFVADWKQARLFALDLGAAPQKEAVAFNVDDLEGLIGRALHATDVRVEDMVPRPGTGLAYVAVSLGAQRKPALVEVSADGQVRAIDLNHTRQTGFDLAQAPDAKAMFWRNIPQRSFTVTDMKWRDGELFVAGLSNQSFASTLRRIRYPFGTGSSMSSTEIYHTIHNQLETRAPIRTMAFASWGGKDYLVAAYTCTPLVIFALDALKDGAHVSGKVVAELGYGNTPAAMLNYSMVGPDGKPGDYLLLTNYQRGADLLSVSQLEAASALPGLDKVVAPGQVAGVQAVSTPMAGVTRVGDLSPMYLLAVRYQLETHSTQLVSFTKGANFRLSDFVSEYNFPSYSYDAWNATHSKPFQNMLKQQEGFADQVVQ